MTEEAACVVLCDPKRGLILLQLKDQAHPDVETVGRISPFGGQMDELPNPPPPLERWIEAPMAALRRELDEEIPSRTFHDACNVETTKWMTVRIEDVPWEGVDLFTWHVFRGTVDLNSVVVGRIWETVQEGYPLILPVSAIPILLSREGGNHTLFLPGVPEILRRFYEMA